MLNSTRAVTRVAVTDAAFSVALAAGDWTAWLPSGVEVDFRVPGSGGPYTMASLMRAKRPNLHPELAAVMAAYLADPEGSAALAVSEHAALTDSVHGITAAAATVLDDATVAAMRTTLQDPKIVGPLLVQTGTITTGNAKLAFRMPFAMTLTSAVFTVNAAPTGATIIVDINEAASTIFSTKPTIDINEFSTATAATPAVISDAALAEGALIEVDIDQVGSTIAGTMLYVTLVGR